METAIAETRASALSEPPDAAAPDGSEPATRLLTPAESARRPLPRRTLITLAVAFGLSLPTSPDGMVVSELVYVLSIVVAILAACSLAAWCEQRIYTRLLASHRALRVAASLFLPLAGLVAGIPAAILIGLLGGLVGDDGTLGASLGIGTMWFVSAAFGSSIVVVLDVLISAVVPDFRSRIQLAVLSLLTMSAALAVAIFAAGNALAELLIENPKLLEGDVKVDGTPLDPQEIEFWLKAEGTESVITLGVVGLAVLVGLPAILSACGKLADAVMERLHPLRDGFREVEMGRLDVRVEEGGSQELRAIGAGFNRMTDSLRATLRDLDSRNEDLAALNRATSRFVPFQFLELLQKSSVREIERGDQVELEISVLFSDIRGFTTMAEAMGPRETFAFINRYLAYMEPEIHRERGFINDIFGDGIMVLFPLFQGERLSHGGADAALRAALGMLQALERFNEALRAEGRDPLRVGIGMNSGALMLGTIGGKDRLSCTVVGDPANAAARVESMTKLYGASLLLTDKSRERLSEPERYRMREIDRVQAKGKNESMAIYEVLDGEPAARREQKWNGREAFAAARALYQRGDFAGAERAFAALGGEAPDDRSVQIYLERCRTLREHPPESWDGITRLEAK